MIHPESRAHGPKPGGMLLHWGVSLSLSRFDSDERTGLCRAGLFEKFAEKTSKQRGKQSVRQLSVRRLVAKFDANAP
jgi:hypothetical protein